MVNKRRIILICYKIDLKIITNFKISSQNRSKIPIISDYNLINLDYFHLNLISV